MADGKILTGLTFEEYAALPESVNFSTLKFMGISPLHYLDAVQNGTPDKPAFALGRAAHTALLEPETWEERYIVKPETVDRVDDEGNVKTIQLRRDNRIPEWREFVALAKEQRKSIITQEDYDKALVMAQRALVDPVASKRLQGRTEKEITILWKHALTGFQIRSRLDLVNHDLPVICDVKSVGDIRPRRMWTNFERFSYLAQAAMYTDAWFAATGEMLSFEVIAVESKRPFDIAVIPVSEDDLESGRKMYEVWLEELARCRESRQFLGIARGKELPFERPGWALWDDENSDIITGDEAA